ACSGLPNWTKPPPGSRHHEDLRGTVEAAHIARNHLPSRRRSAQVEPCIPSPPNPRASPRFPRGALCRPATTITARTITPTVGGPARSSKFHRIRDEGPLDAGLRRFCVCVLINDEGN